MLSKWCYSILIVGLAFVGAVSLQETPNQEITLSFSEAYVSSEETQKAIVAVKAQLQSLGAKNIQVFSTEKGHLKIAYFSKEDVGAIKELLSSSKELKTSSFWNSNLPVNYPEEDNSIAFNLEVSEIQKDSNANHLGGKLAIETNTKNDLAFGSSDFLLKANEDNSLLITKQLVKKVSAYRSLIHKNSTRKKIPEVRAGPLA